MFNITLSPRKRFRLLLRAIFLTIGGLAGYSLSVFLQMNNYGLATICAAVTLAATYGEFIVADVITESRYPSRTEYLLGKLKAKLIVCW